jgi:hypothetical protein
LKFEKTNLCHLSELIASNCFTSDRSSCIPQIDGFQECTVLASAEEIVSNASCGYPSLAKLIIDSNSHLRQIGGFKRCTSLIQIKIPGSLEQILETAFDRCSSLKESTIESNTHLRQIDEL